MVPPAVKNRCLLYRSSRKAAVELFSTAAIQLIHLAVRAKGGWTQFVNGLHWNCISRGIDLLVGEEIEKLPFLIRTPCLVGIGQSVQRQNVHLVVCVSGGIFSQMCSAAWAFAALVTMSTPSDCQSICLTKPLRIVRSSSTINSLIIRLPAPIHKISPLAFPTQKANV